MKAACVLALGFGWCAAGEARVLGQTPTSSAMVSTASAPAASAGLKPLTYAALFESEAPPKFDGRTPVGLRWLDRDHYSERVDGVTRRFAARSGESVPAYDHAALARLLQSVAGMEADAAEKSARTLDQWSADAGVGLLRVDGRVLAWHVARDKLYTVFDERSAKDAELVHLSPRGGFVSFVRGGDLYTRSTRGGEHRLTRGGSETLLNGKLDWVYQEEIYGRFNFGASWWRADDRFLAYLQIDQSRVPEFEYVDNTGPRPEVRTMRYPRPGDPNPRVRLGVVRPTWGWTTWVDLSAYRASDFLIVGVSWAADGRLIFMVQDREQTWLELNAADPGSGRVRRLLRETTPAWVDNPPPPRWLPDGSFLWLSSRDGYQHIYQYAADGELLRRVTHGDWDVTQIEGVDPQGRVVFSGERDGELEAHAYRTPPLPTAAGTEDSVWPARPERLTPPGFSHNSRFNEDCSLSITTSSNCTTPPRTVLRDADGRELRVLEAGGLPALDEYRWRAPELIRIPTRDGCTLNALLIRGPDAPAGRRPVVIRTYAGPNSPIVRNRWGGAGVFEDQMLTQELGLTILHVDPRSAAGRGAVSAWQAYRRLGVLELRDLEDVVAWLASQSWADAQRVAVSGHSYGGFIAGYALARSDRFQLGVAGAPVTDWRLYDSIYTERFMGLPADNEAGYERTSVVTAAENVAGRLLLAHGLLDDNVHFQNAVKLIEALQKHEQQFELMTYPRDQHGIGVGRKHWRRTQFEALREFAGVGTLRPAP